MSRWLGLAITGGVFRLPHFGQLRDTLCKKDVYIWSHKVLPLFLLLILLACMYATPSTRASFTKPGVFTQGDTLYMQYVDHYK